MKAQFIKKVTFWSRIEGHKRAKDLPGSLGFIPVARKALEQL